MLSKSFRAAAAAFVLGTAAVAAASLSLTVTAQAAARPAVGKLLQEAIRLAGAGNIAGARSAVAQAESVGGLTPGDHASIDQVKNYISSKASGGGGSGIAADFRAGRYAAVIAAGRNGRLDAESMQIVAQAYYKTGQYRECSNYIRSNFGSGASEDILQLQRACAYQAQDNEGQRTALELLAQRTNKPEYWSPLLDTAAGTKGISDHGTLDIYRLKLLTGSLTKADDYNLLAQLALQLGFAAESQIIVQKGIDAKLLSGDRTMRLLNMAKTQAATNAANLQKLIASGSGDVLVKLGEDAWGQGKFADALKLVQAGIKKGVSDKSNAQIRLGMALLSTGQKDQAIRAFTQVDDPKQKVIAHLWEIYARTH